tara:strand:- start:598 stop:1902 length:1305 start_codon:yes stop_codon:yes gene_type:complete
MITYFKKRLNTIKVNTDSKILLAVSGGVDSMVLLDLFEKAHSNFSVAHSNFCLRGKESDKDQEFIKLISESRGIECFIQKFNTEEYAKENNISIQMAARELRYSWFQKICQQYNFDFIATAHHMNDSVETLLINLIRGTGFAGLHGIKEIENNIIRPIITLRKEDLIQYAKDNNVEYREDSSNKDEKYIRNKIRNQIIPIMKDINPSVISSVGKTISRIGEVENIYNEFIVDKKENLLIQHDDQYTINIDLLLKETSSKQLLYEFISSFGFYDVDAVFYALSSNSGREFFNNEFYMIKDRNELIISKHIVNNTIIINSETRLVKEPFNIEFGIHLYSNYSLNNNSKNTMFIDYMQLEFPLLLRPWKEGDSFVPLGMKGSKKLSDYFIDKKYSLIEKKKARVLISNNKVVCIIGDRLDDRFKLVETSEKVYIVTV